MKKLALCIAVLGAAVTSASHAQIVFQNTNDNGWFTPFNSSTSSSIRYGDSGWFGSGSDPAVPLQSITLGLAITNSTRAGSTDLIFTFNDGDPSGLVFGTGNLLYSTNISHVALPDTSEVGSPALFSLTIPLPNVSTTGGFNNIGWSVSVRSFDSDGQFGFQTSSAFGQQVGFYTNNASTFDGRNWSLFSFGSGPLGVANFVATVTAPAPSTGIAFSVLGLAIRRRR